MNDKGKRIYLIIISLITLCVIIFGVIRFVGNGLSEFLSIGNSETVTKTLDINSDITEINVDVRSANVLIKEGDVANIYYAFPESAGINLTQENGVLRFSQEKDSSGFSIGKNKREVIITLPKDKTLARVNIKTNSGNINIESLNCDDANLSADSGNIILDGSAVKRAKVDADSGNVEVIGNMENVDASADSGNVKISGNIPNITCEADSGNITIKGELDYVKAKADSGDITIDSNKSEQEMHLNLDADSGKIVVNGRKYR